MSNIHVFSGTPYMVKTQQISPYTPTAPLDLITEAVAQFTSGKDTDVILRQVLSRMMTELKAEAASIFLLSHDQRTLECKVCFGPVNIEGLRIPAEAGLAGQCLKDNAVIVVKDASIDPRFNQSVDAETGFVTKSVLSVPLVVRDAHLGAVQFINKTSGKGRFTDADIRMASALAAAGALAVHSTRLTESLLQQERLERDIAQAAEIQKGLLPQPEPAPFPVAGLSYAATTMSGDFYDFFQLPDGQIYLAIGDVSGKGIRAAMIMSKTISLFRCLGKEIASPGELLRRINEELVETATMGLFVTMSVGLYNPNTNALVMANAGHEPGLLVDSDGRTRDVPANAPPLGIFPMDQTIEEDAIDLQGRTLYMCTDGITEGTLSDGTWLEREGFTALAQTQHGLDLAHRLLGLAEPVTFDLAALRDDVTLLAVGANAQEAQVKADQDLPLVCQIGMPAKASSLKIIREKLRSVFAHQPFSAQMTADFISAVDEACQNVIRYAYPKKAFAPSLTVHLRLKDNDVAVHILDRAPPTKPEHFQRRDLDEVRPGGLGLHIMTAAMDEVTYLTPPKDFGNCLRMRKNFANGLKADTI